MNLIKKKEVTDFISQLSIKVTGFSTPLEPRGALGRDSGLDLPSVEVYPSLYLSVMLQKGKFCSLTSVVKL